MDRFLPVYNSACFLLLKRVGAGFLLYTAVSCPSFRMRVGPFPSLDMWELIPCLSRQFDLAVRNAFWRSIPKLKALSNIKGTSFPSGRNQFKDMQRKTRGSQALSSVLIVFIH